MVYTYTISVVLNYRHILYIKVAHTNYFTGSLNIFIGKTLVLSSGVLFAHLSINGKPYYNSGLFLNKSIDLTSIKIGRAHV